MVRRRLNRNGVAFDLKISIIIPVYNVGEYIRQCVESALSQTYTDFEIILIDDGSAEASGSASDRFSLEDARVVTIHQKNAGVSAARNVGLQLATGSFVVFLDGDDWLSEHTLQVTVRRLEEDPELDLVLFSYTKEYPHSSVARHFYPSDVMFAGEREVTAGLYRKLFGLTNSELTNPESMDYLSTCWGKIYRRSLVEAVRFVDIREVGTGEDGIFNIHALCHCKKAVYLDEPFYHYRKTLGSLTSKYRPDVIEEWDRLFRYMQEQIDSERLPFDFQEALNNRIALSILGVGLNGLDNPDGGFVTVVRYIRGYLKSGKYRGAVSTMRLRKLPAAWKILMFCCKHRMAACVTMILKAILFIKTKL